MSLITAYYLLICVYRDVLGKISGTEIPGKLFSRWTEAGGMTAFTETSTTSVVSVQDNMYTGLSLG